MLKHLWAILASGVLLLPAVAADEPVTVKLKRPAKGETVSDSRTEEVDVTQSVDGMAAPTLEVRTKQEYTDAVLEGDGKGKPTKMERTYKTMEQTAGAKVDHGLAGKTVLIEKGKGKEKFTFRIDGKPVSESAAKLLDQEFNQEVDTEELMMPTKPVKVGDTWEVPAKAVDKMFGEEFVVDSKKVSATGKLVKVYDKNKAKYGVIEYTIELPVASIGGQVEATAGSMLKVTLSMDGCLDGTVYESSSSGKLEGVVRAKVQGKDVTVKIGGTLKSKSEPAKK